MRFLLLAILMLMGVSSFSQDPMIQLTVTIRDEDSGKKLGGATVEVYQDGKLYTTKTSASNGKVPPIDLPVGHYYTFKVKKDGYVTKVATIDGQYANPEDLPAFIPFPVQTSIFQKVDGIDFNFLENEPMIKFHLDRAGYQDWDQDHLKEMQRKIEDLKKEMEKKKEEEAEKRAEFDQYVAQGDKAVGKQEYDNAIQNYEAALNLFDDAEVKKRLADAKKAKADADKAAQLDKDYNEKITAAKQAYDSQQWENALKLYEEASKLKPDEQEPKTKIAEIKKLLDDQKKQEEEFNKFVNSGDDAMTSEKYDDAISNYESALKIKQDAGVQTKLDNAKKAKEDAEKAAEAEAEKEEKYNNLIAEADKLFDDGKYEESKAKYQEALGVKPGEKKPTDQIKKIDEILEKQRKEQAEAEQLEKDYEAAMNAGNQFFNDGKWDQAISKYEEALKLKPDEKEPKDQIEAAKANKEKEANEAAQNEQYDKFMKEGDALKDQKKYEEAIEKYKEAQGIKPGESEPKEKIAECGKLMAEEKEAADNEKKYQDLMAAGNDAEGKEKFADALSKYEEALTVKPGDAEATQKVEAMKKKIADQEQAAADEEKFKSLVAEGDKAKGDKSYDQAIAKYEEALKIKDDADVKAKIEEIKEIQAKEKEASQNKEKYDAAMTAGNQFLNDEKYDEAIAKYEEALTYQDEQEPKDKIKEAKDKKAAAADAAEQERLFNEYKDAGDKAFNNEEYREAKLNYQKALDIKDDPALEKKIKDIDDILKANEDAAEMEEKYQAAKNEADALFNDGKYEEAIAKYQEALSYKDEQYPKDQIQKAKDEIQKLKDADADAKRFEELVDEGDNLAGSDKYDQAIAKYEEALTIKEDAAVKSKIEALKKKKEEAQNAQADAQRFETLVSEGDDLGSAKKYDQAIAKYEEALTIKDDPTVKTKIEELKKLKQSEMDQAALDQQFSDLVNEGDGLASNQKYAEAIAKYKEALTIKQDVGVSKKITDLQKLMDDQNANAATDKAYQDKMNEANAAFSNGEWKTAKGLYEEALIIKPTEQLPKDKILECEEKMKAETVNTVNANYQKILDKAQEKLDAGDLDGALDLYERAKGLNPSDPIPDEKIAEINQIKANQEKLEKDYEKFVQQGNTAFNGSNWEDAIKNYEEALKLKPNEAYPKEQIEKARAKIADNKDQASKDAEYAEYIRLGDDAYNSKTWQEAITMYEKALSVRPNDSYATDRINEINQILKDNASKEENDKKYEDLIQQADGLFEQGKFKEAKGLYEKALTIYSKQYPKDQIQKCITEMKRIGEIEADEAYQKIIEKADEYFNAASYDDAIRLYERAIKLNPTDQYPKDQLLAIDKIRNPNKYIQKSDELRDPGTKLNLTEAEIKAMLEEAREQSEDNVNQDVFGEKEEQYIYQKDWTHSQTDETFVARDSTENMVIEIEENAAIGDKERLVSVDGVEYYKDSLTYGQRDEVAYHENDIQSEYKLTDQIEIEIEQNATNGDIAREDYEDNVEQVKVDVAEEQETYVSDQLDQNYSADEELEVIEEGIEKENFDNGKPREDYEADMEQTKVEVADKNERMAEGQVDETFVTKDETVKMEDERKAENADADLQRVESLPDYEEVYDAYSEREVQNSNDQYDSNIQTKIETEKMVEDLDEANDASDEDRENFEITMEDTKVDVAKENKSNADDQVDVNMDADVALENVEIGIEKESFENDQARLGYEEVVDEKKTEIGNENKSNADDQEDVTMDADEQIEEIEIGIENDRNENDEAREGYEETIEEQKDEIRNEQADNTNAHVDQTYNAKEHTENMTKEEIEANKEMGADQDKNADNTQEFIDDYTQANSEATQENASKVNDTEDYLEDIKSIKLNSITPQMQNELGKKFAEGVTETSYALYDEDGLMKAYVVRRVVVIDGVGWVYEKTQTRYGTTSYSKNGQAISEYQWDDETANGSLKQN